MWRTFEFWDPLYISGTAEDTNFKFGAQIDYKYYPKKCKIKGKEGMASVMWPTFEILDVQLDRAG